MKFIYSLLGFLSFAPSLFAQDVKDEKDIKDYYQKIFKAEKIIKDTVNANVKNVSLAFFPGYGYSLTTKSEFRFSVNMSFKAHNANVSTFLISPSITGRHQLVLPMRGSIWTKSNRLNFVSDFRLMKYPQSSYGLGPYSSLKTEYPIAYNYLRIYETVYRKIKGHSLLGLGFHLDNRWNTKVTLPVGEEVSDLYKLGIPSNSNSTGFSANFLYDNRPNSIYPIKSLYFNANLRQNFKLLGSIYDATIMVLDTRKYIKTSKRNDNVLALWNYNWLTLAGNSPFLDLPSTGWDMYNNMARGYIQGRLRGRNLLYQEAEYRFRLSKDGFFGGVLFANIQTVTDKNILKMEKVYPAAGFGLRFKLKKESHTNLALDYGFGLGGSHGLSLNLGEVF